MGLVLQVLVKKGPLGIHFPVVYWDDIRLLHPLSLSYIVNMLSLFQGMLCGYCKRSSSSDGHNAWALRV